MNPSLSPRYRWSLGVLTIAFILGCSGSFDLPENLPLDPPAEMKDPVDAPAEGGNEAAADDRLDAIRTIYDRYQTDAIPALKELPLSEGLKAAWKKGRTKVDFDPIIDGQDYEIADIEVALDGDDVVASFSNFGAAKEVRWVMIEENGAWVADDIRSGDWSLRNIVGN